MSAEYAKRGSFSIVRKDLTGFGLELLCEARPVPDPNGLNCPSEPALRRLALGTFVCTGRALQAGFGDLETLVLRFCIRPLNEAASLLAIIRFPPDSDKTADIAGGPFRAQEATSHVLSEMTEAAN